MASLDDKQLNGSNPPLRVTLYTNHLCPYAHRAHIALKELGLPYDEVTIDLNRPREPWYLKINPKGLVPSIKISNAQVQDVVLTESTVITQFLADMAPSHLLPVAESSLQAALVRARINFFIDTWNTKLTPFTVAVSRMEDPLAKKAKCEEWSRTVEKEIEPLLGDADPFFGGSKELTLAEVNILDRRADDLLIALHRSNSRPFSSDGTPCQTTTFYQKISKNRSKRYRIFLVGRVPSWQGRVFWISGTKIGYSRK